MRWLNENSGAINAVLTLVLATATIAYVYLTHRLVRENVEAREFANRPILSLTMIPHEGDVSIINLIVENWGNGPALNVRFKVNQPVIREGVTGLGEVGLFKKGLSQLGPHQRIELFLAGSVGNLDALKKAPIEIRAEYRDEGGDEWTQRFTLDFAELEGLTRAGEPPLFTIAKAAEGVRSDLAKLLLGSHHVRVVNYSLEDLQREGKITSLHLKLSQLDSAGWADLEKFVEERLKLREPNEPNSTS